MKVRIVIGADAPLDDPEDMWSESFYMTIPGICMDTARELISQLARRMPDDGWLRMEELP